MRLSISVNNRATIGILDFALLIKEPVLYLRTFFAPANLIALSLGLAVGHLARIAVAALQKIDNVDPLVPSSVARVERQETRPRSPGFLPWGNPFSDLFTDPRGDVFFQGVVVHF